jgi:hypothetical protein
VGSWQTNRGEAREFFIDLFHGLFPFSFGGSGKYRRIMTQ